MTYYKKKQDNNKFVYYCSWNDQVRLDDPTITIVTKEEYEQNTPPMPFINPEQEIEVLGL